MVPPTSGCEGGRTFFTALEHPIGEILTLPDMVSTTSTETGGKRAGVTVSWQMAMTDGVCHRTTKGNGN